MEHFKESVRDVNYGKPNVAKFKKYIFQSHLTNAITLNDTNQYNPTDVRHNDIQR